jgi:malonyl-CoA O-methyltransferase
LKELRALYEACGWPAPTQPFTDMHDWGDLLVEAGFAEPVMDMERIVLSFETPERLLQELRELGRNFHPQRFQACRGRAWQAQLKQSLQSQGPLELTFEVIYGHAFKAPPRAPLAAQTVISLKDMKSVLRQGQNRG